MKYIVTIKKENENGDMPRDGENNVYEISTSQLETKWREMGVDWLAADGPRCKTCSKKRVRRQTYKNFSIGGRSMVGVAE